MLYPCSYDELAMSAAANQIGFLPAAIVPVELRNRPIANPARLNAFIEEAQSKVAASWDTAEVTGAIPTGATVYIQFVIFPRGNHDVPVTETSSGYASLDSSCMRAVQRIKTFGHMPRGYDSNRMTMFYHCTYPGPRPALTDPVDAVHNETEISRDSPAAN